jgi:hemolysin activation/secretion protein
VKRALVGAALVAGLTSGAWGQPRDAGSAPELRTRRVQKFVVEGNTLLPDEELRRVLRVYEGKELTLDQMKEAAADVTSLYQRQGYYLVRAIIPQQDFATSEVKISVIQGKVGKVNVQGAEHYDPDFIRRRFETAVEDGTFRADEFSRALILLNELPDLEVKAVFVPSPTGEADVNLQVKDKLPLHFDLDYNNYGTPETGQHRLGVGAEAGNLLAQGDRLAVRGVIGFPTRSNTFYQVDYNTPVNLQGTTVRFGYANGAFSVSEGLAAILDVRGDADIYSVSVAHPLDRELDFSSNLSFGLSHKHVRNTFFGGSQPLTNDEYTMGRLTYQADWRGPSGRTIFQAAWAQGLGGTSASDPLVSRVGANGTFSRFNFDVARIHRLDEGLYGVVRGSAQLASGPLYVGEQYALGGPDTVRGYQQAELLGDNAYLVGIELRWSPVAELRDRLQLACFVDHGGVSLRNPQPGDLPRGSHLTGAGVGVRWGIADQSHLRVDLGFPIAPSDNRSGTFPVVYIGLQNRF